MNFIGLSYEFLQPNGTTETNTDDDIMNIFRYTPGIFMIPFLAGFNSLGSTNVNATNRQLPSLYTHTPRTQICSPYIFGGPIGRFFNNYAWVIYPNYACQLFANRFNSEYAFTDASDSRSFIYHNVSNIPQVLYINSSYGNNNLMLTNGYKGQYGVCLNGKDSYNGFPTYFIRIWYRGIEMKLLMSTCSDDISSNYPSGYNLCSDSITDPRCVILMT